MTWDVLLVLLNPRETLRLTGLEHGRAIPLAVLARRHERLLLAPPGTTFEFDRFFSGAVRFRAHDRVRLSHEEIFTAD